MRAVTVAAIDGPIISRLKWHLGLNTTIRTRHRVHLPWLALMIAPGALVTAVTTSTRRLLACRTTRRTTAWRVGQSAAGIEFLLAYRKGEFLLAVATIQRLITQ